MKFVCRKCEQENDITDGVCTFAIRDSANINRPDVVEAVNICPIEDSDKSGKMLGTFYYAQWKLVD
jgi:hypothetical protein